MPEFSDAILEIGSHLLSRAAAEQGGIISGDNPTHYSPSNPIRLWIIQAVIIIGFTEILHLGLSRIRQPRVIAEVVGGIILGPTVMGRIPKFSKTIFPPESLPPLSLMATVGLVLFLFLVALEIDPKSITRNIRTAAGVSAAGILLPFGMGVAIAVPIYHNFIDEKVSFGHFLLFVGVAIAITAFPVLCRILMELKLLDTNVGVVVLSAGIGNDVVGWILLALTVALVNASSGLTALWILLASVGFTLFLFYPVKWGFHWLCRKTGSLETGVPTPFMITVTLLLIFGSAFFTDIIGVHAIFGGFLAGLIVPHEGGFAIAMTEKIEDLVTILFLPLYFTLSGLRTNLGLLDTGKTWAYVVLICAVAFFGKFLGCAAAAKWSGFNWREAGAVGTLMSCKGLVELIVLNIGLQAGILDTRIFSIFVLHALVLTFVTTPLTLWVYPPHLQTHAGRHSEKPHDGHPESGPSEDSRRSSSDDLKTRFTVVLSRMDHVTALMSFTQFLQPPYKSISATNEKSREGPVDDDGIPKVSIEALRLIELTERTSAVMRGTIADDVMARDTVLGMFRTFTHLNRIPLSSTLSILQQDEFSSTVAAHARYTSSDLVVIPWASGGSPSDGSTPAPHNPLETLFGKNPVQDKAASVQYAAFVRKVFAESPSDVALYFDRAALSPIHTDGVFGKHIFLPFFGGPDDRLALTFVVQLCTHHAVTATVIKVTKTESEEALTTHPTQDSGGLKPEGPVGGQNLTIHSVSGFPDTIYPQQTTQIKAQSGMADSILWGRYAQTTPELESQRSPATKAALGRITFGELTSPTPLQALLEKSNEELVKAKEQDKSFLVVVGRARRLAVESHVAELRVLEGQQSAGAVGSEVRATVGDVGSAVVMSALKASLLVVQSSESAPTA